jgi:hypothetical protein
MDAPVDARSVYSMYQAAARIETTSGTTLAQLPSRAVDLPPGDRITMIQRIGASLRYDDLPDLNLTLDTFGIPPAEAPSYDSDYEKYVYVLRRIAKASDPVAVGIHAHLYPDAENELGKVAVKLSTAGPWKYNEFKLFLTHTDANKVLAGKIRTRLSDYGIDTYVAHDNIKPTTEWQEEIEAALRTCNALAALLTPDFIESMWCDQEVGTVFGLGRCIIGVKQGALPHGFIGKYQAVNGDDSAYASWVIAERIVDALWVNAQTRPLMSRPAAVAYTQSTSFGDARANYARIVKLRAEEWTDEMVEMVKAAPRENNQVGAGVWFGPGDDHGKPLPELLSRHLDELLDRKPPIDTSDFEGAVAGSEDDIPF